MHRNNISDLGSTLNYLINLKELALSFNEISNFNSQWFKNLVNLNVLYLNDNHIEQLPRDAFSSLKNLTSLSLHRNKLKVIHAYSFGTLPNLITIKFHGNELDALDEMFIDNTGVLNMDIRNNICADRNITDVTISRESMRAILETCFVNYRILFPEPLTSTTITTSSPSTLVPGCIGGNIDERICIIEDTNQEFKDDINFLKTQNQKLENNLEEQSVKMSDLQDENERLFKLTEVMGEMIEDLIKEKNEMRENFESQSKYFSASIEELKNQMLELSSRPCACR
ncbi:hypothetical protein ACKWTF_001551 [Chironomus riparius]